LKVTYQTKTPEHVNPRISGVTKTALHIQQQRIMTGDYRLRTRRKYSLKTSYTHTHFLTEVTSHLLEDNIPKNNPQHPRICETQNFRCSKNSLAHSATENDCRTLWIKNEKKTLSPNFTTVSPISLFY